MYSDRPQNHGFGAFLLAASRIESEMGKQKWPGDLSEPGPRPRSILQEASADVQ